MKNIAGKTMPPTLPRGYAMIGRRIKNYLLAYDASNRGFLHGSPSVVRLLPAGGHRHDSYHGHRSRRRRWLRKAKVCRSLLLLSYLITVIAPSCSHHGVVGTWGAVREIALSLAFLQIYPIMDHAFSKGHPKHSGS